MKKYLYYISIFLVFAFSFYISGYLKTIESFFILILYGLVLYIFYFFYKKFRKKKLLNFKIFLFEFIKKISFSVLLIGLIIFAFAYYQNKVSPAKLQEITISNGNKIVVFQEMSHIASQKFYDDVKNNLISYKKDGFVYFFEGVKPGKKENMEAFNEAIGVKFDKDLYNNFSKLYGLTFQNQKEFLGLINNLDFNVDVDINRIIKHYNKIKIEKNDDKQKEVVDLSKQIINELTKLNDKELTILRFVNKAVLNFLIKSDVTQSIIQENFANKQLFDVILDGRNKILSDEIIKSKYDKIYITYGKLHFSGIYKILKNNSQKWKIKDTKEMNFIY